MNLNEQRTLVYKTTPTKLKLVDELIDLIKHCFPNVETNGMRFDDSHLKLDKLTVKMIEIDPQELGGVLVHWYPNFKLSTQTDPYCSAYILTKKEINTLIGEVKKIKEYYIAHQPKR